MNTHVATGAFVAAMLLVGSDGAFAQCDDLLVDIGNTAACGLTQTSVFTLPRATHVHSLEVWYNTQRGGMSLPFALQGPRGQMSGVFLVKSCDPYQSQWCAGDMILDTALPAGQYRVTTSVAAICQNTGSGGNGFIKVRGCVGGRGATDFNPPQGTETSDCIPGSNPFQEDVCVKNVITVPTR